MTELILGLVSLCAATLAHLTLWRIRVPHRQTRALLITYFGTLGVALLVYWHMQCLGIWPGMGWLSYLRVTIMFTAFTLAYVITYSAVEADSPSLVMVMAVAEAGHGGLETGRFYEMMNDETLVAPRIADLVRDGHAIIKDGRYVITPKGRIFSGIFIIYRRLLGAAVKGG